MPPIQFKDYYDVLGVDRAADDRAIKTAFRERARKLHPDVNRDDPAAEEKFKDLNEAYDVLSDKDKRQRYDTFGADWERYQQAGTQGAGNPFTTGSPGRQGTPPPGDFEAWFTGDPADGRFEYHESQGRFSDFFNLIFNRQGEGPGARAGRSMPQRGKDLEVIASVSLREAISGTSRQITVRAPESCSTCSGTGLARGVECPTCDGTGQVQKSKRLEVRVPPGVHTGSRVRVAGQGGPGIGGGPNGDVYLAITVAPDSRFTVKSNDIHTTARVPLYDAILGGEAEVETVESRIALTIPPGTQQGKSFRLWGKGMPKLGSKTGERGDLIVRAEIAIPDNLSDRERSLFTELRNLRQ